MKFNDLFIDSNLPKPLENEELYINYTKMKNGDIEARKNIIIHNIRLVKSEVLKRFSNCLYDLNELISIGLIGLIKSVDTFDITKKLQFSTYATKCIDNEIRMFMRKSDNYNYVNHVSLNQPIKIDKDGRELFVEDTLEDYNSDFVTEYENNEVYKKYCK